MTALLAIGLARLAGQFTRKRLRHDVSLARAKTDNSSATNHAGSSFTITPRWKEWKEWIPLTPTELRMYNHTGGAEPMLVDVHSHFFRYPDHFSKDFVEQARRARNIDLTVRWEEYHARALGCDRTIVFGGKARLAGLWVPDQEVAGYASAHADKLIGFLSVDPTQADWQDELSQGHQDLKLKGIKLMPMYAGFYPNDRKLDYLWEYATRHHLPVLLHTGTTFIAKAPLDCTIPRHIDNVAIRFPHVKIIMAHLSHPYEGECVVVIRKHPNVYSDCSALHYRPFQLYHSLMLVQEYGVWDKVLFGSDFPFTTVDASLDEMRRLNYMLEGTSLPRLDMAKMENMFQRNTLELLEMDP